MADTAIHKGLAGVVADTTAISTVDAATDSLTYRGYPVQDLAETRTFEEVAHLIWTGDLPDREQLTAFTARERGERALARSPRGLRRPVPESTHPMDVLRTATRNVGADAAAEARGADLATAERLMARLPSVVAADRRRRTAVDPIPPDPSLGFAENFFHMCFGEVPGPGVVPCFEAPLVPYAVPGFNASTFAARVGTAAPS